MCFPKAPKQEVRQEQPAPPPMPAPTAPVAPNDTPEANRAAATARRRLRIGGASAPRSFGTGLRIS